MCKVQHGIALDIMNDIFRKRNITCNTEIHLALKQWLIKTDHYGLGTTAYLGPKIWDLVLQKIKAWENINIFKSNC